MSYLKKLEKFIEKSTHKEEMASAHTYALRPDHILQLRLSELSRRNLAIKIYSEVLGCEVWLCGNEEMAAQIKEDDPEAITYTVAGMRELIKLNPGPEELKNIHNAKSIFPGSKIIDVSLRETSDKSEDAQND